jgi:hypothetical protein
MNQPQKDTPFCRVSFAGAVVIAVLTLISAPAAQARGGHGGGGGYGGGWGHAGGGRGAFGHAFSSGHVGAWRGGGWHGGGYYGWGGYYPYWGWPYSYSSWWGGPGVYIQSNAIDAGSDDGWSDRKPPARERSGEDRTDVRSAPNPRASSLARLRFRVSPDDAVVYLDDRYLGAGDDLAAYPRGVVTEPGTHTVTVARPGFKDKTITVTARAGSPVDVAVDLEK